MRLQIVLVAVVLALCLAPEAAEACAACFSARDENRMAFLLTTLFLTALPLGMIGGAVAWLRWRVKQVERERTAATDGFVSDARA